MTNMSRRSMLLGTGSTLLFGALAYNAGTPIARADSDDNIGFNDASGGATAAANAQTPFYMGDDSMTDALDNEFASADTTPNRVPATFPTIQAGSNSQDILAAQYLISAGGAVPVKISSTWNADTTTAMKKFQALHNLPQTGVADPATLTAACATIGAGTQSCNRVIALHKLLAKHGYVFDKGDAPKTSSAYDAFTDVLVRAFQAGHGITQQAAVAANTWRALFGPVTSGPIYPLMQYQTGTAMWTNCGPTSAVMIALYLGKNPPKWNYSANTRDAAVEYWRNTLCKMSTSSTEVGTTYKQLIPAFASQGISSFQGGVSDAITAAKAGKPSIVGGDSYTLSWNNTRPSFNSGPASHFIAVLGWNGSTFIVCDPLSYPTKNFVHNLTEAQLRNYAATAPGWGPNEPGNDVAPSVNSIITR